MTSDQEHDRVPDHASTLEAHKSLFQRFYERAWNDADPHIVDEVLGPTFINHMLPPDVPDHREAYRQAIIENQRLFPDYALALISLVAEGALVAAHWHSRCTVGNDAPPDLRPGIVLEIQGMTLVRIADGHITDFWKYDNAPVVLAAARANLNSR